MRSGVVFLCLLAGCAGKEPVMPDPLAEARTFWCRVVGSLDEAAFVPLGPRDLPTKLHFQSVDWTRAILRQECTPHRARPEARLAVHVARPDTLDFLRYEYRFGGLRLTVTESSQFLHVLVREIPQDKYGSDPLPRAEAVAALLLAPPRPLRFAPDGAFFSSAPGLDAARIDDWSDRVDGEARADGVVFLCYKFRLEREELQPPRGWFDDDFRAKWKR